MIRKMIEAIMDGRYWCAICLCMAWFGISNYCQVCNAQTPPASDETIATVTLQPDQQLEPISKYIYGQFVEHLGKSIYGGLWAEMLQDRKFYFPVTDQYNPWGTGNDPQWNAGAYHYLKASPWKVIGPAGTVTMDSQHPFTGSQSPTIHAAADASPTGISQDGLALQSNAKYVGSIVLAGDAAPVIVKLVSDDGQTLTQSIDKITADFQAYPLEFTSPAAEENAHIEIVTSGKGTFTIGTLSLMPADNIDGWRHDVVDVLKELNSPIYRWPGGNFVSGYNWRDGIGPRDQRPPRKNPAWTGVENNDVGIHEFMNLMQILGSEPYVALNTGLGTAEQAAEEVEYLNGSSDTPMGKLRAGNGHPEPFHVRIFAVGNEMFGAWQLGHMALSDYVKKHDQVADAIWKIDPKAELVAVGAVGEWDQTMLSQCADHMTYLSEHIYVKEKPSVPAHAAQLAEEIARVAAAHREYLNDIPSLRAHHIRIAMDEWNYWYGDYLYGELGCQYHLKDALGVARGLHEYFRNSDLFYMANYAQTINVLGAVKTNRTSASMEATGLVLELYRNHFGTIPIQVADQPANLDVSAAWTDDKAAVTIAVVNCTTEARQFTFAGVPVADQAKQWIIGGTDPEAHNEPGKPPVVTIVEKDLNIANSTLDAPPLSIALYRLDKK
jgi:alpha-L-arabinofuranosidase